MAEHTVTIDLEAWLRDVTPAVRRVIRAFAARVREQMRESFREPKSGRTYKYRGRYITASAPGEAPAQRSGALARSITSVTFTSPISGEVLVKAPYAAILEFEKDRPFVRPAVKYILREFDQGVTASFGN